MNKRVAQASSAGRKERSGWISSRFQSASGKKPWRGETTALVLNAIGAAVCGKRHMILATRIGTGSKMGSYSNVHVLDRGSLQPSTSILEGLDPPHSSCTIEAEEVEVLVLVDE